MVRVGVLKNLTHRIVLVSQRTKFYPLENNQPYIIQSSSFQCWGVHMAFLIMCMILLGSKNHRCFQTWSSFISSIVPSKLHSIINALLLQKERLDHAKSMKGGSFKLKNYPLAYFETNPFKEDKCKLINIKL